MLYTKITCLQKLSCMRVLHVSNFYWLYKSSLIFYRHVYQTFKNELASLLKVSIVKSFGKTKSID